MFGVKDTLTCLEMGAVETLIVWENLDMFRFELMNASSGETVIKNLTSQQVGASALQTILSFWPGCNMPMRSHRLLQQAVAGSMLCSKAALCVKKIPCAG